MKRQQFRTTKIDRCADTVTRAQLVLLVGHRVKNGDRGSLTLIRASNNKVGTGILSDVIDAHPQVEIVDLDLFDEREQIDGVVKRIDKGAHLIASVYDFNNEVATRLVNRAGIVDVG